MLDALVRGSYEVMRQALGTGVRLTSSVLAPLTDEERLEELRHELARQARRWLELPESLAAGTPAAHAVNLAKSVVPEPGVDDPELVRRRFQQLLTRSSDVNDKAGEPALLDIVSHLSPDEARMLRLLAKEGPVPYVDLVRVSLVGTGSEVILPHLSMLAARAGCRHPERDRAYLENLRRLGLVTLVRSEIEGHSDYQLIEGLADYIARAKEIRQDRNSRARMRKGHILLTALAMHLLEIALPDMFGDEET